MSTLLLRLAGPLQSWGVESKFETRRTLGYPTKSGVLGMAAAALGYSRENSLDRLNTLRFGIRIEREGELLRDYHTAKSKKNSYITERFYLADAVFLAGLESGDLDFLKELENAFKNPAFPLFLGRRSCVPTMPIVLGIRDLQLLIALQNEPWQLSEWRQKKLFRSQDRKLRIIADSETPDPNSIIRDVPVSFSPKRRQFTIRSVKDCGYVDKSVKTEQNESTEHDIFADLGNEVQ